MSKRKPGATPKQVRPWKGNPDTDPRYAARVARAIERGEYTTPGTKPNPMDPAKVARKRIARAEKVAA